MNTGRGKSHTVQPNINPAFIIGGGAIVALGIGSFIPLALALGIAVIAGGSGRPPDVTVSVTPDPEQWVCDFCFQRPVKWRYPCDDFEFRYPAFVHGLFSGYGFNLRISSVGDWAADDPCHAFIERDDWESLFERYWTLGPEPKVWRAIGVRKMQAHTFKLHPVDELLERGISKGQWVLFQEHRTGPAQRVVWG